MYFKSYIVKNARSLVSDIRVGDEKIANLFTGFIGFFIGLTWANFISGSIQYISTVLFCILLCRLFECLIKLCNESILSF
jgi:hypothetical protein